MTLAPPETELATAAPPADPLRQLQWRWLLGWVVLTIAVALLFFRDEPVVARALLLSGLPVACWFGLSRSGREVVARLLSVRAPVRILGAGALVGVATWALHLLGNLAIAGLFGVEFGAAGVVRSSSLARDIETVAFAPLVEELVFRGVLLNRLAPRIGIRWAVILSSLPFGILHGDTWGVAFLTGALCAVLYAESGSLWPAIVAHGVHNLFAVLVPRIMDPREVTIPLGLLLASLAVVAGGLGWMAGAMWPRTGDPAPWLRSRTSGSATNEQAIA